MDEVDRVRRIGRVVRALLWVWHGLAIVGMSSVWLSGVAGWKVVGIGLCGRAVANALTLAVGWYLVRR